jgi:hypothetical protein
MRRLSMSDCQPARVCRLVYGRPGAAKATLKFYRLIDIGFQSMRTVLAKSRAAARSRGMIVEMTGPAALRERAEG